MLSLFFCRCCSSFKLFAKIPILSNKNTYNRARKKLLIIMEANHGRPTLGSFFVFVVIAANLILGLCCFLEGSKRFRVDLMFLCIEERVQPLQHQVLDPNLGFMSNKKKKKDNALSPEH